MCGWALAGDARQPPLRLRCDTSATNAKIKFCARPQLFSNRGNFPSLNSRRRLGLWTLRKAKPRNSRNPRNLRTRRNGLFSYS
jgi:hypothetical protein